MGSRVVPFSRELYVERTDFREDPPRKYFRLAPGREVRLRYAYFITCREAVKDPATGEVVELRCTYDPATRGGYAPDGRKVRGTIHWVSAPHAVEAEVRLYDHLFTRINPEDAGEGADYKDALNPASLETLAGCRVEPSLRGAPAGSRYQFERQGYFCVDPDSTAGRLVVNRTVHAAGHLGQDREGHSRRRRSERACRVRRGSTDRGQTIPAALDRSISSRAGTAGTGPSPAAPCTPAPAIPSGAVRPGSRISRVDSGP